MNYSITQLADMSGVSTRTLRFYDEIGLLKPAFYAESKYRYYTQEELLILQQILFYRELGFQLKEIQTILTNKDFNKIEALKEHKQKLQRQSKKIKTLIATIDKTVELLEKDIPMENKELYSGFDNEKQEEYENYLIDTYNEDSEDLIKQSKTNVKKFSPKDWSEILQDSNAIYTALTHLMTKSVDPEALEVQLLIAKHFKVIQKFYQPTAEVYAGLGELYCKHPDFRKYFDKYDQNLPEFLAKAMQFYAKQNIK